MSAIKIKLRIKTIPLEVFKILSGSIYKDLNAKLCVKAVWIRTVIVIRVVTLFFKLLLLVHVAMTVVVMPFSCRNALVMNIL